MIRELHNRLRPVRRRLTLRRAMPIVAAALMAGGWLALMAALLALFGGSMTAGLFGAALAVGLPLAGAAWALFHPAGWHDAARAVDRHFHLHDRTLTALHLAEDKTNDPFAQMQIEDAAAQLKPLSLRAVALPAAPWQRLAGGLALTAFALALTAWAIVAPPSASIQTSGDLQDIRPEIIERGPARRPHVDSQTAQNGLQLFPGETETDDPRKRPGSEYPPPAPNG